jgi:NADPH-dependent curcumin reductase CurA
MAPVNRRWLLKQRPVGMVGEHNFEWQEAPVPAPGDGEALVRVLYLSFDPAMRGWMEDRPSYIPPVALGEPMRAGSVAQVVTSNRNDLAPGDLVEGMFGWQDYAIVGGRGLAGAAARIPDGVDPCHALGVLGITGLTAYFGLLDLGQPRAGEVVLVSGAAGATGSVAGQIARIHGCRVIGIAGGPDKCRWLTGDARFDAAIDYKNEDVASRLRQLAPDGIDVYFDNVGGEILETALAQIRQKARVVLCGGISGYNEAEPPPGPRTLMNLVIQRARMEGFIVIDYAARFGEAREQLSKWLAAGELVHREDVQEGLENAPATFQRLFQGKNTGKQLLKIADPA